LSKTLGFPHRSHFLKISPLIGSVKNMWVRLHCLPFIVPEHCHLRTSVSASANVTARKASGGSNPEMGDIIDS
jgi:hypothetical protein